MTSPSRRGSMADMESEARLLVVDDDRELSQMLHEYLTREGFSVDTVADGQMALDYLSEKSADLVILDVMLPGASGLEVLQRLRAAATLIPVLMLTARGDDVDRILGLELGADDYLAKPFNPRELAARVRAIMRRTSAAANSSTDTLHAGPVVLDTARMSVTVEGQAVQLTGAEFRILEVLLRQAGKVVSREQLTEQALGRSLELYDRSVDTHVSNLRRKLTLPVTQTEIRSIRGAGYVYVVGTTSNQPP